MSTVTPLIAGMKLPKFVRVEQYFPHNELSEDEIRRIIADNFAKPEFKNTIKPGMKICITAGSRGVSNIVVITRAIVDNVKKLGGEPFIIPAMGSHGGATAEGQRGILEAYNITEETMGCPIRATMETVKIGHADEIDVDVQIDKFASESDGIIVVNRIKAHTGFKGKYESGLMKMMTIGLGKQAGAYVAHSAGDDNMPPRLLAIGSEIIRKAPVIMGIGLMENGSVNYIIYTGAVKDDTVGDYTVLHRKAMVLGIPCMTSLDTANALMDILGSRFTLQNTELVDINHMRH